MRAHLPILFHLGAMALYFAMNSPGGPSVANNSAAFGPGGPRGGGIIIV